MKTLTTLLLTLIVSGGCSSLGSLNSQLGWASQSDYLKVKNLISKGADVNEPVNGSYPLYRALSKNNTAIARLLLENGANPNLPELNSREYPMAWAVVNQSEVQVKMLLENGANPNGSFMNGDTYLVHAALKNNIGLVRQLLDAGANPNLLNSNKIGPLAVSARHGNYELTSLLLRSGAKKDLSIFWNEVLYYNSSTYFIVSVFLDLDLIGEPILIGSQNEKGFVGKGILINPSELFRYEGYLEESMANGEGKLITKDFIYEGVFERGQFVSGTKSLKVKTFESNKNISSSKRVDAENLSVTNPNKVVEITKDVLVGTGEVTGKIFVGLMKFTGQVLLGVAKELPSAYAEQKRIEAISKNAYRKGVNDARRRCQGSTSC